MRRQLGLDPTAVVTFLILALVIGAVAVPDIREAVGRWIQRASPPTSVPTIVWSLPTGEPSRACVMTTVEPPLTPPVTVERSDWFSRVGGWIAYSDADTSRIWAVDPLRPRDRISLGPARDVEPWAWSRDGTRLLLRQDSGLLYVMKSDGAVTWLIGRACVATGAALSPDGRRLAYVEPSVGLYVVDTEGGTPWALDTDPAEPFSEAVAWAPDGSRIAWFDFTEDDPTYGHHAYGLSFVNPDGTGLRKMVMSMALMGSPSLVWSPDGSRLAFSAQRLEDGPGQIFVIDVRTLELRQITRDGDNKWPAWSPDGSRIAFVRGGKLFTMAPDGRDVRSLGGAETIRGPIAWNPAR